MTQPHSTASARMPSRLGSDRCFGSLRIAVAVAVYLLLSTLFALPASAHSGDQSYLYLDITESELSGRLEMPFADLREVLDFELDGSPEEVTAELESRADDLEAYAAEHVRVGADGTWWPLTFDGVSELEADESPDPSWGYVLVSFTSEPPAEMIPRTLDVQLDPFFDEVDGRDALLLIGNDWNAGVVENGEEVLLRFTSDERVRTVDLGDTSWTKNFSASFALGVDHIRTGPDHILFVLVLLLPSVLIWRDGQWGPTKGFGSSLWRVLKVVTMFTVAHTITFTLAGLDILPLPSPRFTESVIALSIAAAALHNLRPVFRNREWLLAFVFGLFHGMGFASLVVGLDVSRSTQLISLLGRNLGIEVGQVIVVVLIFPGLFLLRETQWYRPFFIVSSLALTTVSLAWVVARLFDVRDVASPFIENLVAFPRVLGLILLFTIGATVLHRLSPSDATA